MHTTVHAVVRYTHSLSSTSQYVALSCHINAPAFTVRNISDIWLPQIIVHKLLLLHSFHEDFSTFLLLLFYLLTVEEHTSQGQLTFSTVVTHSIISSGHLNSQHSEWTQNALVHFQAHTHDYRDLSILFLHPVVNVPQTEESLGISLKCKSNKNVQRSWSWFEINCRLVLPEAQCSPDSWSTGCLYFSQVLT